MANWDRLTRELLKTMVAGAVGGASQSTNPFTAPGFATIITLFGAGLLLFGVSEWVFGAPEEEPPA